MQAPETTDRYFTEQVVGRLVLALGRPVPAADEPGVPQGGQAAQAAIPAQAPPNPSRRSRGWLLTLLAGALAGGAAYWWRH